MVQDGKHPQNHCQFKLQSPSPSDLNHILLAPSNSLQHARRKDVPEIVMTRLPLRHVRQRSLPPNLHIRRRRRQQRRSPHEGPHGFRQPRGRDYGDLAPVNLAVHQRRGLRYREPSGICRLRHTRAYPGQWVGPLGVLNSAQGGDGDSGGGEGGEDENVADIRRVG